MAYDASKHHINLNGEGYILSRSQGGIPYYQKKRAPTFVNKFGSGDSSYRDATFWQYWANTSWRNGAKQLRVDDPGKFWASENINVTQLDEITLSRKLTLLGQTAAGTKVNTVEAWRNSQSWWNSSYGYRQQITITAPSAAQVPVGYPVKVSIDTAALQTATKVRSDRNDWRILYFNGSSWVDLTRHYVNTTQTYFAVQNAIAAGQSDGNYYVYYGFSSESTSKQPSSEADYNAVYGMFGATPDANSVAILHFREGSGGSVNDDSSNSNNGTFSSPAWGATEKFGYAGDFSGSQVDIGSNGSLTLGSMTLEGWFKFDTVGSNQQLINRRSASGTGYELLLNGTAIRFAITDGTGEHVILSTTTIAVGTTYHIAATHDGSTMKLYINNVLESSLGTGVPITQTGNAILGKQADGSGGQAFDGKMSHVRISNTARTSFPYALTTDPSLAYGSETTTQPPSSSFDKYFGCSNGKLYKHDGVSMTEEFDARRIIWFESGNDTDMKVGDVGGTETAQAQSFTLTANQATTKIKGVELYLKKFAGTPGDITVRIETETSSKPSGTLADSNLTATIPAFTTSSYGWISVEFPAAVALGASTNFWIVVKIAAGANDNNYSWATDGSSPSYSSGNMATSTDGGSTWSADSAKDAYFRLKGETTSINDLLVSSVGSTRKMLIATGDISGQVNGSARLYSFDGNTYSLEYVFSTSTESSIIAMEEYSSKLYAAVGPQGKIYQGTAPGTWTLSKDIDVPQNPGYVYTLKEYNGYLYAGGGSPEFLPDKHYNGFWYRFDGTTWSSLYPFGHTEIRSFEFYDAFLFGSTYHGQIYVYDTSTLNPLFNFKDGYGYNVTIHSAQLYDDKIYLALYPQEGTNDTNVGIWVFDRHGLSLAHKITGPTGYRCMAVVNNQLIIGTGDDGNVYYLDLNNYVTQGFLQTSYFDANLPSINKLYNAVTVQHDPLVAGQSVVVYFKFKDSDSWTTLGTSDTLGATSATLTFPSGTYSKKITLKIELNTSNTATTPKVREFVLQYTLYPEVRWLWTIKVLAKTPLTFKDGTKESRTPAEIRADIEEIISANQLITFTDISGTSYTVLPTDLDETSWVVNQSSSNENEIALTLLQS